MGITGAWMPRSPLSVPGPFQVRWPPPSATSARAALPGSLRGWRERAQRAGAGPRPAGVAGRPANRQQAKNRSYQWAGASGNRGPRFEPLGGTRWGTSGQLRWGTVQPSRGPDVSWARTPRLLLLATYYLFIHFPKEATKDPSLKLPPPPSNASQCQIPSNTQFNFHGALGSKEQKQQQQKPSRCLI